MTNKTMAQIAKEKKSTEGAVFMPFVGGAMEYIYKFPDGSYIGVTPAQGGGFDYWAYEIGYF